MPFSAHVIHVRPAKSISDDGSDRLKIYEQQMKEGLKFGVENAGAELLYSIIFYTLHSVERAKYRTLSPVCGKPT